VTPNGRRLTEYVRACVVRAHRHTWIHVRPERIRDSLGWSDSTYRRALKSARKSDARLILRTVFDNDAGPRGSWKILAALPCKIDNELMLHATDSDGRVRIVRDELRGQRITLKYEASDCHPVEDELKPDTTHTRRPSNGCSVRTKFSKSAAPPAMLRLAWAITRRWLADVSCSKWRIRGELRPRGCARAISRGLAAGLDAESVFKRLQVEVELAHVHNTDQSFDRSGKMRPRSFGIVIERALSSALDWVRPSDVERSELRRAMEASLDGAGLV
jgi:hypothetical protein